MTQIGNRKAYGSRIEDAISRYQRYAVTFSLAIFDIDTFKSINDSYGHQVGDNILKEVCNVVSSILRKNDYFYRLGGDEFVLVLSNTGLEGAGIFAERIRSAIEQQVTVIKDRTITISMGVSEVTKDDGPDSLFRRADDNLYKAKEQGRNQVVAR